MRAATAIPRALPQGEPARRVVRGLWWAKSPRESARPTRCPGRRILVTGMTRSTTLSHGPARRSRAFLGVLLQGASAMPHNSRLPRDVCSALLVLLVLCCVVAGRARADVRGAGSNAKSKAASLLREPVAFRVYQRDRNGRADIAVALDPGARGATLVSARLSGLPG